MTALQSEQAADLAEVVRLRTRGRLAELEMTQLELAEKLGISPTSMSQRLKGRMEFALSEVPAIAAVLNTTEAYLLGFSDERSPRRAIGGGSLFLLQEREVVRGCRDSNPRPSDLYAEGAPGAVILDFRRRTVPQSAVARGETEPAVRLAQVLPLIGRVS